MELLKPEEYKFKWCLKPKEYKFEWCLNGDWHSLTVRVEKAPCAFHRFMQRWLLGIHWRKCNDGRD